jgi:hypothetical protein
VGGERKKEMKMKKMKRMMESVGKRQELGRRQQLRAFSSPFRQGLPVIERVQERKSKMHKRKVEIRKNNFLTSRALKRYH